MKSKFEEAKESFIANNFAALTGMDNLYVHQAITDLISTLVEKTSALDSKLQRIQDRITRLFLRITDIEDILRD